MVLEPKIRFGSYEIGESIGVGVLYRAKDTNLKREVEIKVFPASLASGAERLARVQREAEVLGT